MTELLSVPQFHLYGEDLNDAAYDFVHAEPIQVRARQAGGLISLHRHKYLRQVVFITHGRCTCIIETKSHHLVGPVLVLPPPDVAHGFQFDGHAEGVVISFTDDVVRGKTGLRGGLHERLMAAQRAMFVEIKKDRVARRLKRVAGDMVGEIALRRDGYEIAMKSGLALIIVEISRIISEGAAEGTEFNSFTDEKIERLRQLIEDNFHETRHLTDYANWLNMTPDRLNEHCKRITGQTAGSMVRQRLLIEAKRQLVYSGLSVSEIAYDLNFSDPSYFSRFFRKATGVTPQQFRLDPDQE